MGQRGRPASNGRKKTPTVLTLQQHLRTLYDWMGFKPEEEEEEDQQEEDPHRLCNACEQPILYKINTNKKGKKKHQSVEYEPHYTCRGPCDRHFHENCVLSSSSNRNVNHDQWFCTDEPCKQARKVIASALRAPCSFGVKVCAICFKDLDSQSASSSSSSSSSSVIQEEKCMFCDFTAHRNCLSDKVRHGKWICGRSGCVETRKLDIQRKKKERREPIQQSKETKYELWELYPSIDVTEVSMDVDQDDSVRNRENVVSNITERSSMIDEPQISQSNAAIRKKRRINDSSDEEEITVISKDPDYVFEPEVQSYEEDFHEDAEPKSKLNHRDTSIEQLYRFGSRRKVLENNLPSDTFISELEKSTKKDVSSVPNFIPKKRKKDSLSNSQQNTESTDVFIPIPKKRKSSLEDELKSGMSVSNKQQEVAPDLLKVVNPHEKALSEVCRKLNDECFENNGPKDRTVLDLRGIIFNAKGSHMVAALKFLLENLSNNVYPTLFKRQIDRTVLSLLERDLKEFIDGHSFSAEERKIKREMLNNYLRFLLRLLTVHVDVKRILPSHFKLAETIIPKLKGGSLSVLLGSNGTLSRKASDLLKACEECDEIWNDHKDREKEIIAEKKKQEEIFAKKMKNSTSLSRSKYTPISPAKFAIAVPNSLNTRRDSKINSDRKQPFGGQARKKLYWHYENLAEKKVTIQLASYSDNVPASQITVSNVIWEIQDRLKACPKNKSLLRPPKSPILIEEPSKVSAVNGDNDEDLEKQFNHLSYLKVRPDSIDGQML